MTRYEVWTMVEGALDESHLYESVVDAFGKAHDLRAELATSDAEDWAVYVLPHYCDGHEGECECVQYLTDHSPMFAKAVV